MALTTLLGSAQLSVQDALAARLDVSGGTMRVPNFVVVSLRRESFLAQYCGAMSEEWERFRRELETGVKGFLSSHGWRVGGTGSLVLNMALRSIGDECSVQARTVDTLYELLIRDDAGARTVGVRYNLATIGRAHEPHPRGFVPVNDSARLFSREHLRLSYCDLHLTLRLLGRNSTELNGDTLGDVEVELHRGDVIGCGTCEVEIGRVE